MEETSSPPPDILLTGYFKEYEGYSAYRSRGSGSWLVTYTIEGLGRYRQPGLQVWAEPGDLLLLQPGAFHDYGVPPSGYWEFLWAHFQPRVHWLSWWQLPEIGNGLYQIRFPPGRTRERVQQVFFQLHTDMNLEQTHRADLLDIPPLRHHREAMSTLQRELALNGLEEVLLLGMRENAQRANRTLDPRVQQILDLVAQNLNAAYDLETLAQTVALSPSRLSHLFKQEVGDSVTNVILTLRLNKAARMLEFSSLPIRTIADEVGFNSAFYFSRQFHQRFGMSPRAYRNKLSAAQPEQG